MTEDKYEIRQTLLVERILRWCGCKLRENWLPLTAGMVSGILAYMFAFTNKLLSHDEVGSLFIKGDTVSSGRWGLEFLSNIMPDYSMPWIYGIMSLVFLTVASCVVIRTFHIRNRALQVLLPGLLITFPSMIGTFTYMFTASSYALSFLLAVRAVYWMGKWELKYVFPAMACMVLSLGIYQSYIAVAAGLLVLLVVYRILEGDEVRDCLLRGAGYVLFLGVSLIVYYILTKVIQAAMGIEMNPYATQNLSLDPQQILIRSERAYAGFFALFETGIYGLMPTELSRTVHRICVWVLIGILILWAVFCRKPARIGLMVFLLAVFPLSVNCMFLFTEDHAVHTLVLYGVATLYVLLALVIEKAPVPEKTMGIRQIGAEVIAVLMAVIIVINTYVANEVYLNLQLRYEHTQSFYSNVIARIMDDPEYDEGSKIAFIGTYGQPGEFYTKFEEIRQISGANGVSPNNWSNYLFLARYMGFEIPFASQEEIEEIQASEEFENMAIYPYYGSIQKIGDIFVIKLY